MGENGLLKINVVTWVATLKTSSLPILKLLLGSSSLIHYVDCRELGSEVPHPSLSGYPIAEDNCDFPVCYLTWRDFISQDSPVNGCPGDTVIERTWIAQDSCGNEVANVQTITIDVGTDGGMCEPDLCPQEPCALCECDLQACECCAAGGITACTPVPCTPVACTPVECIPCELDMGNTLSPAPFCDDSTPCIPNIVPIFVDDSDGYNNIDSESQIVGFSDNALYWIERADYWRDEALGYLENSSSLLTISFVFTALMCIFAL